MLKRDGLQKQWNPLLDEPLRSKVRQTAFLVFERLRDPEHVIAIAQHTQPPAGESPWSPESFGKGLTGVAFPLAFLARAEPGQEWGEVAHRYLGYVARATQAMPYSLPGLFSGTAGLASIVSFLAHADQRYRDLLDTLTHQLCDQVQARTWRRQVRAGVAVEDYDVIKGASGILAYLVTVDDPDEVVQATIGHMLEYLVWLAGTDGEQGRKRWYTPPEFYPPVEVYQQHFPRGYYSCGLAHGIPGPLAALASAWMFGHRVSGQREAMEAIAAWLQEQARRDQWGVYWPYGVPDGRKRQPTYIPGLWASRRYTRDAWCYGAPGVARAIWLAGTALEDDDMRNFAIEAIEGVLQRPAPARGINAPTVCHGIAGLLVICLRFAHESGSLLIREQIPLLVEQVLASFDNTFPFGFQDLNQEGQGVDQADWLRGASGVALALLAASTNIAPSWDHTLLIS